MRNRRFLFLNGGIVALTNTLQFRLLKLAFSDECLFFLGREHPTFAARLPVSLRLAHRQFVGIDSGGFCFLRLLQRALRHA